MSEGKRICDCCGKTAENEYMPKDWFVLGLPREPNHPLSKRDRLDLCSWGCLFSVTTGMVADESRTRAAVAGEQKS